MSIFDGKNFNPQVFQQYIERIQNLKQNQLIKSGAIRDRQDLAMSMADQVGGNFLSTPLFGLIANTTALNYDGKTDGSPSTTDTFMHDRIVVGRQAAWTEKDFSYDITGKTDFMANIASQVSDYWQGLDQDTLVSVLKGIFKMSTGAANIEFVSKHTVDITTDLTNSGLIGATTVNTAMQKALGDNKSKFALVIMHSVVATNLENLKIVQYAKYTDDQGLQREVTLATLHGRAVLIDDGMPSSDYYVKCASTDAGALEIVADNTSSPTASQIKLASVTPTLASYTKAVGDYVKLATAYTTYILGQGAIEYTDCGVKVPYETYRDPKTNGGQDTLYSRQRKSFAPYGISFTKSSMASMSPTTAELETGANWTLVNSNGDTPKYIPHRSIPIAQLISLG